MKNQKAISVYVGETKLKTSPQNISGAYVSMLGEDFYKINNVDAIDPFFMSIVSSSNQWFFISATGGLTAGRVDADQALFPYYTVDKVKENSENTGRKCIVRVTKDRRTSLWEPFSTRYQGLYQTERNIYKNMPGSVVVFEEINEDLGLVYRYAWRTSDRYGFAATTWLLNLQNSGCKIELLDGFQNILPANVSALAQIRLSTLLDAYKRNELNIETGLGIFSLNSTLTDLAEPSESLLATTVFQVGLDSDNYLLSTDQLDKFRGGWELETETEKLGKRGAYFVSTTFDLEPGEQRTWHLIADVSQSSAAIVQLSNRIKNDTTGLIHDLERDFKSNNENLKKIVAGADGLQVSSLQLRSSNHFANVMFNVMRGGVFADQYWFNADDFIKFTAARNPGILEENTTFFSELAPKLKLPALQALCEQSGVIDLLRMSYNFLPLSFSRRHGDPSRPWNQFAINIMNDDGSKRLEYEGNWRDIFQNWEALAYSYPEYIESMICTFLNATTVDGYNPYRITFQGIEWELPDPGNPWSNIGYWSDHQIIYLLKLLEISSAVHPYKLDSFLTKPMFTYANVPYRIKSYSDLLKDPYNTIEVDWEKQRDIDERVESYGTDGKLVYINNNQLLQVGLGEKLLLLLLAKLVNFVPEGGIWMNTQRPEWNDANNALVGKGLSVVTLGYLRRYIVFCRDLLVQSDQHSIQIINEIQDLYVQVADTLRYFQHGLENGFSDGQRRAIMDALGTAGSNYRLDYYRDGIKGETTQLPVTELVLFLELALRYVEHSLKANRRADNLYHAYNILNLDGDQAAITRLYEMLEGQVAILSSGLLSADESLELLESLRQSQLYSPEHNSYILYPDRKLPGFLEKNCIKPEQVHDISLVSALVKANDKTLLIRDEDGKYHFNSCFRNIKDVHLALNMLEEQDQFAQLVKQDTDLIATLFEETFHHDQFTGRSGTFFAYEGLGSVYWHMVSKLLLAVQETIMRNKCESSTSELIEKYLDIQKGQSYNKTPQEYGAFPTDPYSHSPKGQGAKQPGLTGMVKEEILTRQVELGFTIENGQIVFNFLLLDTNEFLNKPTTFNYWGVDSEQQELKLDAGSLAYTMSQVPIIIQSGQQENITIFMSDGNKQKIDGHKLDAISSAHIFQRDNAIHHLQVSMIAGR